MNTAYIYIGPFPENLYSDFEYLFQAHRLLAIPSSYHILHAPDPALENTHVTIEIPTDQPVTPENECKVHNVVDGGVFLEEAGGTSDLA
ncbi:hypothetical protein MW887_009399 [Aspergillus wentii]|nr:hypothetical protein MW887_009399 [Aspergillus wentii]